MRREEIGLWPRWDNLDGVIPNIRAIFWQGSDWLNQLPNINKGIEAIQKLDLVSRPDHHAVGPVRGLPAARLHALRAARRGASRYKGHYYIHRPKVIEPLGESKTDFQIFTELAYRLGFGPAYNPKATREYFHCNDDVDEAYLREWWETKVVPHQGADISWEEFKRRGVYKFVHPEPHVAFRENVEKGIPFNTPSGKIEIFSTELAQITDWTRTQYGRPIPPIPKWIDPKEYLGNKELTKKYLFHLVTPHPRWRTHSIFNNCSWLRETYEQEVTINASDAARLGIKTGDIVEVWNDRGRVVLPAYVTERCMPGVLVIYEGAWMFRDENGVDRAAIPTSWSRTIRARPVRSSSTRFW